MAFGDLTYLKRLALKNMVCQNIFWKRWNLHYFTCPQSSQNQLKSRHFEFRFVSQEVWVLIYYNAYDTSQPEHRIEASKVNSILQLKSLLWRANVKYTHVNLLPQYWFELWEFVSDPERVVGNRLNYPSYENLHIVFTNFLRLTIRELE